MKSQILVTIPSSIAKMGELVVLPRKEFEKMRAQIVPSFFLKGKGAKRLDKRASEGLREYHKRKTELLESFLKKEYGHLYKGYGN